MFIGRSEVNLKKAKVIINIINFLFFLILSGCAMSKVEEPSYTVKFKENNIEIREYPKLLAAQVQVSGERYAAINDGFKILADFIFGNNKKNIKIQMTAPVSQTQNERIAMTAPVTQRKEGNSWKIQFIMPSIYTIETLPTPNNSLIKIIELEPKRYIVIRFSGMNTDNNLKSHLNELMNYIQQKDISIIGEPIYAFYNPPWTLPFLKRNEILIEIK